VPPGSVNAATGTITILLNGAPVGTTQVLNMALGTGVLWSCAPDAALNSVDCNGNFNSALIATHDQIHANDNFCDSTNGTPQYTCSLSSKALLSYSRGSAFLLAVDTTCSTICALSVNGLPSITINQPDGVTAPNGLLAAGRARWIWFDGSIFRLI
jgi:hypothetical protein